MRERLAQGGDIARGVLRELFPNEIWLQPDTSGRFLWAVFDDGIGAALFDYGDIAERFPILEKSACVVAGACFVMVLHFLSD
jgi:hypothetical protein